MNELRLLEEIRNDFVSKFDNDPQVKRICNIIINEFKARSKALTLTDVVNCNCDESKQLEEEFEINHLINDTYQVVGKDSSTVWKQGTMEECNDWVML